MALTEEQQKILKNAQNIIQNKKDEEKYEEICCQAKICPHCGSKLNVYEASGMALPPIQLQCTNKCGFTKFIRD